MTGIVRVRARARARVKMRGGRTIQRSIRSRGRDRGGGIRRVRGEDDVQHAFNVAVI